MAPPPQTEIKEVAKKFRSFNVYKDGTVDVFLKNWKTVPPSDDSVTGVRSKDVTISTQPPVSARIFLPKLQNLNENKNPVLFYIHGGGFSKMSAFSPHYHRHCTFLAAEANAVVVSVKYGLFPTRPIPACYEDSWIGLQWVASHVNGNGPENWLNDHVDYEKLFIGGDSAGGNITHDLSFRAGTIGLPDGVKLNGAFLVHPFFGGSEYDEMWMEMCVDNKGLHDPRMNPSAEDIGKLGCGRVLIFVAGNDCLKGPGEFYYEKMKMSGFKGSFEIVENENEEHCFHLGNFESEKAVELQNKIVSFLKQD